MMNKRGENMVWAFMIMFVALLFSIFLGVVVFSFNLINDALSYDIDIGQVNLKEVTEATFGQINTGLIANADTIGVIFLFGMCLLMMLNGYFTGSKYPKLFFIIDFFLLALFFIPSVYISQVYELFINSTDILSETFIDVLPKTSKFMLNLPIIIATAGIITMIVSYSGIKPKPTQSVAGF